MQLAEHDKNINTIEKLIKEKNNDILQKYIELKSKKSDNELLRKYETHFLHEKEKMNQQIKALEVINKHLDNVSKMEKSQINILNNIKKDQKEVLKEILKIKKYFDKCDVD